MRHTEHRLKRPVGEKLPSGWTRVAVFLKAEYQPDSHAASVESQLQLTRLQAVTILYHVHYSPHLPVSTNCRA